MTLLILGLAVFIGVHLVTALTGTRTRLIARLGAGGFRGLYSLASAAGLGLIIAGYAQAPVTPIWFPPAWTRHVTFLLMLPVFPLLIMSQLPGRLKTVIGHPMLLAVKLWAIAHLLVKGTLAAMILMGALLAWAVFDLISVKRRERAGVATVATGPIRNDIVAVVVGVALYLGMMVWGHAALIGVPLLSLKTAG
jgi:uncharacterized membrane protein